MILPIDVQLYYFISTLLAGIIVGVFFDIYRIIRGFNTPNKIITAISDILFWILAGIATFIFLLCANNGDLRYYTFVGLILGLISYFILISRGFIRILEYIIYLISKLFRIIFILLIYPVKLVKYFIGYGIFKIKVAFSKLGNRIKILNNKTKPQKKKDKSKT